jgi:flagellar basal body L-ring protein FlgH
MTDPTTKIKVWTFQFDSGEQGYTVDAAAGEVLLEELRCAEVGDRITIDVGEMSQAEYDAMPEYEG